MRVRGGVGGGVGVVVGELGWVGRSSCCAGGGEGVGWVVGCGECVEGGCLLLVVVVIGLSRGAGGVGKIRGFWWSVLWG